MTAPNAGSLSIPQNDQGNQGMKFTVLHLTGWSGTGKSTQLQQFSAKYPGSIQILTPENRGQMFDPTTVDWENHSAVAIDEVLLWDRVSVAEGIASLEGFAEQCGKKIIVVSQAQQDLSRHGVVLRTAPLVIRLEGRHQALSLSFDGQRLTFPTIPAY
jgi:hypothetical protein